MSYDQATTPAGRDDLPSERSLAMQVLLLSLGVIGYIAFTFYLNWIGFFPDVSVMS